MPVKTIAMPNSLPVSYTHLSPAPIYTDDIHAFVLEHVLQPTVDAMAAEGRPFAGVLYAGLMLTADGPKVLELSLIHI